MRIPVLGLLALMLVAAPFGSAGSTTKSYATPSGTDDLSVTASNFPVEGSNIGGAMFTATGAAWLSVSVSDATGGAVGFLVGQDLNGDGFDDNTQKFCGTGAYIGDLGFDAGRDLHVYVTAASVGCVGVGTTGTITVTTA